MLLRCVNDSVARVSGDPQRQRPPSSAVLKQFLQPLGEIGLVPSIAPSDPAELVQLRVLLGGEELDGGVVVLLEEAIALIALALAPSLALASAVVVDVIVPHGSLLVPAVRLDLRDVPPEGRLGQGIQSQLGARELQGCHLAAIGRRLPFPHLVERTPQHELYHRDLRGHAAIVGVDLELVLVPQRHVGTVHLEEGIVGGEYAVGYRRIGDVHGGDYSLCRVLVCRCRRCCCRRLWRCRREVAGGRRAKLRLDQRGGTVVGIHNRVVRRLRDLLDLLLAERVPPRGTAGRPFCGTRRGHDEVGIGEQPLLAPLGEGTVLLDPTLAVLGEGCATQGMDGGGGCRRRCDRRGSRWGGCRGRCFEDGGCRDARVQFGGIVVRLVFVLFVLGIIIDVVGGDVDRGEVGVGRILLIGSGRIGDDGGLGDRRNPFLGNHHRLLLLHVHIRIPRLLRITHEGRRILHLPRQFLPRHLLRGRHIRYYRQLLLLPIPRRLAPAQYGVGLLDVRGQISPPFVPV
mmetsp:Transcript_23103/g.55696  ORF Transcript_23103/g.55696 Transcript_23103/m.55696 type:complete len:514 (+) Transcript_23103:2725-4266(+)